MRLLFLLLFSLSFTAQHGLAQHDPNVVAVEPDTHEVFIQGKVLKKFGVFSHVSIENFEDIYLLPLNKQEITIQGEFNGVWKDLAKAEIYRMDEENREVEIKLLEDISSKAERFNVNWKYNQDTEVRLKWLEIF